MESRNDSLLLKSDPPYRQSWLSVEAPGGAFHQARVTAQNMRQYAHIFKPLSPADTPNVGISETYQPLPRPSAKRERLAEGIRVKAGSASASTGLPGQTCMAYIGLHKRGVMRIAG